MSVLETDPGWYQRMAARAAERAEAQRAQEATEAEERRTAAHPIADGFAVWVGDSNVQPQITDLTRPCCDRHNHNCDTPSGQCCGRCGEGRLVPVEGLTLQNGWYVLPPPVAGQNGWHAVSFVEFEDGEVGVAGVELSSPPGQPPPQPTNDRSLMDRLDAAIDGLCPCGGQPRPGSAYCSYDCEPNHRGVHTDDSEGNPFSTPMRWRPDLVVAEDDDTGLELVATSSGPTAGGGATFYLGEHNARLYRRTGRNVWHLRLDDDYRWVGTDVVDEHTGEITDDTVQTLAEAWSKLERELGNPRHAVAANPEASTPPVIEWPYGNNGFRVVNEEEYEAYRQSLAEWVRANGINPDDVLLDGIVNHTNTSITVDLVVRDDAGNMLVDGTGRVRTERFTRPLRLSWDAWQGQDPAGRGGSEFQPLVWLRGCPQCRRRGHPTTGRRPTLPPLDRIAVPRSPSDAGHYSAEPCHMCPHCRTPLPGPPLHAYLHTNGNIVTVRVTDPTETRIIDEQRLIPRQSLNRTLALRLLADLAEARYLALVGVQPWDRYAGFSVEVDSLTEHSPDPAQAADLNDDVVRLRVPWPHRNDITPESWQVEAHQPVNVRAGQRVTAVWAPPAGPDGTPAGNPVDPSGYITDVVVEHNPGPTSWRTH